MLKELKDVLLRRMAVRKNVTLGKGFHVGPGSVLWAPRSLSVGNDVYVGKNVTIEVDGEIGDGVLIANLVGIVGRSDHDQTQVGTSIRRSKWVGDFPEALSRPTRLGADVWIGYGAVILSGVSIGDSSIVAAGTVVTKDIPPNSVVVGNPGRIAGNRFTEDALKEHWSLLRQRGVRSLVVSRGDAK